MYLVAKVHPAPSSATDDRGRVLVVKADHIRDSFDTEENAVAYAKKQAVLNPSVQYAVYGISRIFETTTPTVIEKQLDSRGQVVPVPATETA